MYTMNLNDMLRELHAIVGRFMLKNGIIRRMMKAE